MPGVVSITPVSSAASNTGFSVKGLAVGQTTLMLKDSQLKELKYTLNVVDPNVPAEQNWHHGKVNDTLGYVHVQINKTPTQSKVQYREKGKTSWKEFDITCIDGRCFELVDLTLYDAVAMYIIIGGRTYAVGRSGWKVFDSSVEINSA